MAEIVIGALVSKVLGGKPKGPDTAAMAAAQRRQEESLQAQEASVKRQRQAADAREADLSKQLAGQRRAVLARRSSRGQLAFSGPSTSGLKTTLGG